VNFAFWLLVCDKQTFAYAFVQHYRSAPFRCEAGVKLFVPVWQVVRLVVHRVTCFVLCVRRATCFRWCSQYIVFDGAISTLFSRLTLSIFICSIGLSAVAAVSSPPTFCPLSRERVPMVDILSDRYACS